MRRGEWSRLLGRPAQRLAGKTLGLLGMGRIGSMAARKASALELQVLAFDPHLTAQEIQLRGAQSVSLRELLARSDFVSLHVPLTANTRQMLGAPELAQMKPGAVLINTSRGGVLDEDALYQALAEGRLGAAGLDVFAQEPLPADSRLRLLDNVVMSPHLGSYSQEAVAEMYLRSANLAAALLQGRWVDTIVNPQVRPQAEARWRYLSEQRGG
jgi:phosphoglycerate dehydrogenase-like enzyme